jgi:hypothetical protein
MGRPKKVGLDYMSLDCDVFDNNKKMTLFLSDFPASKRFEVFGIWVLIMLRLYATSGYYLLWDEDEKAIFASRKGLDHGYLDEIVERALDRRLFDRERHDTKHVLTSAEITERYLFAKDARVSAEIDCEIAIFRGEIGFSQRYILISQWKSAQSKEKNNTEIVSHRKNPVPQRKTRGSGKVCEICHGTFYGDECLKRECIEAKDTEHAVDF